MAALTPSHLASLAVESRELAGRLASRPWAEDVYLAGSGALALYTGHRPVRDLDLMAMTNRLVSADRRDLLADLLALEPGTRVETARDGYLFARLGGVGVRFYYYPYPLIEPVEELHGLSVASPLDLGLMKLGAIISRGTRRDFVDLYLLCQQLSLRELLVRAADKFGHVRDFPLQALKGLADRSEVGDEPLPRLASPLAWDAVVTWLDGEIANLSQESFEGP